MKVTDYQCLIDSSKYIGQKTHLTRFHGHFKASKYSNTSTIFVITLYSTLSVQKTQPIYTTHVSFDHANVKTTESITLIDTDRCAHDTTHSLFQTAASQHLILSLLKIPTASLNYKIQDVSYVPEIPSFVTRYCTTVTSSRHYRFEMSSHIRCDYGVLTLHQV
jgi:hypothetical protein